MNGTSLYTYDVSDGTLEVDDVKCVTSNVENIFESQKVSRNGKPSNLPELELGDTKSLYNQCSTTEDELFVDNERVSSLSDSDSFGFNLLFDMKKVVENVKIKVRERRLKKLEQFSSTTQAEKGSLIFNSKESTRKEGHKKTKVMHASSSGQSDSDSLGLRSLFEETKSLHKQRKKRKKTKNVKKHFASKGLGKNESFGLELLFGESNMVNDKRKRGKKRKRKSVCEKNEEFSNSEETSEPDESDLGANKKKRPNYFVAIRVSNPKIHQAASDFQASILKENAKLKPALIPLPTLHLTMAVMNLDETLTEIAKGALDKCKVRITEIMKSVHFKLQFIGVGNFKNEVVFAKAEQSSECLKSINKVITSTFEDEGVCVNEEKEWKPHLTFLKLSRKRALRKKGIKKIKECIYESWSGFCFGEELVNSVHLCSMFEPKEKDGFYKCIATISINDSDNNDSSEPPEVQNIISAKN